MHHSQQLRHHLPGLDRHIHSGDRRRRRRHRKCLLLLLLLRLFGPCLGRKPCLRESFGRRTLIGKGAVSQGRLYRANGEAGSDSLHVVHRLYRCFSLRFLSKPNEAESAAPTGVTVFHDNLNGRSANSLTGKGEQPTASSTVPNSSNLDRSVASSVCQARPLF